MEYEEFLKKKVVVAESFGMKKDLLNKLEYSENLYPHRQVSKSKNYTGE